MLIGGGIALRSYAQEYIFLNMFCFTHPLTPPPIASTLSESSFLCEQQALEETLAFSGVSYHH